MGHEAILSGKDMGFGSPTSQAGQGSATISRMQKPLVTNAIMPHPESIKNDLICVSVRRYSVDFTEPSTGVSEASNGLLQRPPTGRDQSTESDDPSKL